MDFLRNIFGKNERQSLKRRETHEDGSLVLTEEEKGGVLWKTNIAEGDLNQWKDASEAVGAQVQEILQPGEQYLDDMLNIQKTVQKGSLFIKIKLPAGTAYEQKNKFWNALKEIQKK